MDLAIDPPSFGVLLDATGAIRETEAPRLQPRLPGDAAPLQQPKAGALASTAADIGGPTQALANGAPAAPAHIRASNSDLSQMAFKHARPSRSTQACLCPLLKSCHLSVHVCYGVSCSGVCVG